MSSSIEIGAEGEPMAPKQVHPREIYLTDIQTLEIETIPEAFEPIPSQQLRSDEITYPDGGSAWIVIIGCFFGLMADFGLINSISAIEAYVSTHQLEEFSTLSISWIFSVFVGISYMCGIFSGVIFDEIGAKLPLALGSVLIAGGIVATAYCSKPYQFILAFGLLTGVGTALCMNPLIGVISHWFMKRRGLAMGIATLGASVGGIIFPLMLSSLYQKVGYSKAMILLGMTMFLMLIIAFCLIKERPELRKALEERSAQRDGYSVSTRKKSISFLLRNAVDFRAFKDLKYTTCVISSTLLEVALVCSLTFFSSYAINVTGTDDSTAFNLVALVNGVSVAGRIVPNYLSDRYGVFNVFILMSLACSISLFTLWLGFGSNISVLYVFAVIYGFFSASVLSLIPVACAAITPTKHFGKRYATMYLLIGFGCLIGVPIGGTIIGEGSKHNFDSFILFVAALSVAGLMTLCLCRYLIGGVRLSVKI